jgi:ABC-type branched-subunit amino acid transport system ATPase component
MDIEAKDVTARFGRVTILEAVNVTIRPGQMIGLIGPNGSGKTTLRPPDLIDFSMTPNRRLSAVRCQETEFRWC